MRNNKKINLDLAELIANVKFNIRSSFVGKYYEMYIQNVIVKQSLENVAQITKLKESIMKKI